MNINQVVVVPERKTYIKVIRVIVCDAHENAQIAERHVKVGINLWHQHLDHLGVDDMKLLHENLTFCEGFVMANNIRSHSQLKELHGLANC